MKSGIKTFWLSAIGHLITGITIVLRLIELITARGISQKTADGYLWKISNEIEQILYMLNITASSIVFELCAVCWISLIKQPTEGICAGANLANHSPQINCFPRFTRKRLLINTGRTINKAFTPFYRSSKSVFHWVSSSYHTKHRQSLLLYDSRIRGHIPLSGGHPENHWLYSSQDICLG